MTLLGQELEEVYLPLPGACDDDSGPSAQRDLESPRRHMSVRACLDWVNPDGKTHPPSYGV